MYILGSSKQEYKHYKVLFLAFATNLELRLTL